MTKHDAVFEFYYVLEAERIALTLLKMKRNSGSSVVEDHEVWQKERRVAALETIHSALYKDGWYQSYDELK